MSEPFLAEIRIVGFNFAPRGWAFCDGQILPINQNQSLYSLLGTTYGGDGRTSFALPDVRGRVPIHVGNSGGGTHHTLGQKTGEETHTLSVAEMPQHQHPVNGTGNTATEATPNSNLLPAVNNGKPYASTASAPMGDNTIAPVGGGQAHNNMQPYLAMNYCIALQGLFPSRN
ncbi:tail Collar domain-containing protein [Marinicella pacifica]|uniref:Tail Collar domain-containing protein n=1 Tax=Marinicella pacifica TaxID=1171543 RepID=A0A917CF03_9GAMM|nr:tail fiber protein [Marinicella pacifica]GGF86398.1 tail Collar domain-containing protein [Marinicella pacifica]